MIEKFNLIKNHNIKLTEIDYQSLLAVGNHHFAFNCDITGFQTFINDFAEKFNPITTLSNDCFESYEETKDLTLNDLVFDEYYKNDGRILKYPVLSSPKRYFTDGTDEEILKSKDEITRNAFVYQALRESKHRANLFHLSLQINGASPQNISNIKQELDLLTGTISSKYTIDNEDFEILTFVNVEQNQVCFQIKSEAFAKGLATLILTTYKGSHRIAACDTTRIISQQKISKQEAFFHLNITDKKEFDFEDNSQMLEKTENHWQNIWQQVFVPQINFDFISETQNFELQRRVILSIYNLLIHSSGNQPAQETGLACNSWYGKFHLEMHLWHSAWAPLYNLPQYLASTMKWYFSHTQQAKENAEKNGFQGLRWPKMIDSDGYDSPSIIAPLLIWQQSHFIFLSNLLIEKNHLGDYSLQEYWQLIKGTANFMLDFLEEENGKLVLNGPMQCAQEEFVPTSIKNPTFELAYWKYCLKLVVKIGKQLNENITDYQTAVGKIDMPQAVDGLYPSHSNAPDTFPKFMKDHPMQIGIYGMFDNEDVDKVALQNTLSRVLKDWDESSMWGWDYGYMAMAAVELGDKKLAVEILLKECPKNYYAKNGHNFQLGRNDLPQYLPGNGALLWAIYKLLEQK